MNLANRFSSSFVKSVESTWFDEPWGLGDGGLLPGGKPAYRIRVLRSGCRAWEKFLAKNKLKPLSIDKAYAEASGQLMAEKMYRKASDADLDQEEFGRRFGELVRSANEDRAIRIETADLGLWMDGLSRMIVEWDLKDEAEEPIPVTSGNVRQHLFENIPGLSLPLAVMNPEAFQGEQEWSAGDVEGATRDLFKDPGEIRDAYPVLERHEELFRNLRLTPDLVRSFEVEGIRVEYRPKKLVVPYGGHGFGDANALWLLDCIERAQAVWKKSVEAAEGN